MMPIKTVQDVIDANDEHIGSIDKKAEKIYTTIIWIMLIILSLEFLLISSHLYFTI